MKVSEKVEATGSEISYRCPQCRTCEVCKHESTNDTISVKEEVEQSLVNASVSIDLETKVPSASLPLIADPTIRLGNNKDKVMKVYLQQVRKFNHTSNSKDKQNILDSEERLPGLGHVDYVTNLSAEI